MKSAIKSALKKFFTNINPVMAIDFGSQRTRLWTEDRILDEPSVVAVDTKNQLLVAAGLAAAEINQRLAPRVTMVHPIQAGEIVEPVLATELLKILSSKILHQQFFSPTIVASFGAGASPDQIERYSELLYKLGAKEVIGVAQPLAAAIGSGVPVADSSGALVVVIGAGVVEAAVVALGSMVASVSKINTLTNLAQAIIQEIIKTKQVQISYETAEKLISNLVTVELETDQSSKQTLIMGKSVQTGAPEEVRLVAINLYPALKNWLEKVELTLTQLLQNLPPELMVDVVTKGLLLTGGMAKISGLEAYLVKKLGIPVALAEEPELAVIKGLKLICQNLDLYKQSLAYEVQE